MKREWFSRCFALLEGFSNLVATVNGGLRILKELAGADAAAFFNLEGVFAGQLFAETDSRETAEDLIRIHERLSRPEAFGGLAGEVRRVDDGRVILYFPPEQDARGIFFLRRATAFSDQETEDISSALLMVSAVVAASQAYAKLDVRGSTDFLSGLANRRCFEESLDQELERAIRYRSNLAVAILDLDNFKAFNDTYGHQMGDQFIRKVGGILSSSIRRIDLACRVGGDEFALILPIVQDEAHIPPIMERISDRVQAASLEFGDVIVGISYGLARFPGDGETGSELYKVADSRLYGAKEEVHPGGARGRY